MTKTRTSGRATNVLEAENKLSQKTRDYRFINFPSSPVSYQSIFTNEYIENHQGIMESKSNPESKQERIRRVAREWYAKNKERIQSKKLNQCHEYRRRLRIGRGRPTRIEAHPERVMTFNTQTQKLQPGTLVNPLPELEQRKHPLFTAVERGSFLVSFEK